MSYSLENALFQWEEGERYVRALPERERRAHDRGIDAVLDELRRRLGSTFTIAELADLYARDPDWPTALAQAHSAATDTALAVDAAFSRYAREAADFSGGRPRS